MGVAMGFELPASGVTLSPRSSTPSNIAKSVTIE